MVQILLPIEIFSRFSESSLASQIYQRTDVPRASLMAVVKHSGLFSNPKAGQVDWRDSAGLGSIPGGDRKAYESGS